MGVTVLRQGTLREQHRLPLAARGLAWNRGLISKAKAVVLRHPVLTVLLLALLVRVITALAVNSIFGTGLTEDDDTYSSLARDAAAGKTAHWDEYTESLYWRTSTLLVPLTAVYEIFGPAEIYGQLFLGLFGAGTAALVTRLALRKLQPAFALASGLVVALLPSQILFSSLTLKDSAVWFMLAGIALLVTFASEATGWKLVAFGLLVGTSLFLLAHLREHTLVVASWALVLASWVGSAEHRLYRVAGAAVLALTVPWVSGFGPAGYTFVANAGSLETIRINNAQGANTAVVEDPDSTESSRPVNVVLEHLDEREKEAVRLLKKNVPTKRVAKEANLRTADVERLRQRLKEARRSSAAEPPVPSSDSTEEPDLTHLPRGLSVTLLEPFPWQSGETTAFDMARAETVVWYPILVAALLGVPLLLRRSSVGFFPVVLGGGILVTYALTEGNVGTAYRHRGELVWIIALAFGFAVSWMVEKRKDARGSAPPDVV